ncbi:MAG: nucleoside deaminase [Magnetococcales bacterium]|nr:nucleoside deaminase [Magnetococcales bacterium]
MTGMAYLTDGQSAALLALVAAGSAGQQQEVPVGAVLRDAAGRFLGECGNNQIAAHDPTGHAELRLLRQGAARVGNYRLTGSTLTVTLEPCPMCLAALGMARVVQVTYEARNPLLGTASAFPTPEQHYQPVVDAEYVQDLDDADSIVVSSSAAHVTEPAADAGLLLRIFFDNRRQI